MPNRRTFLLGASAAVAGTAGGAAWAAAGSRERAALAAGAGLPLTVVNHTYRYANNQIWLYVVGTDLITGRQVYARRDGGLAQVSLADNGPDGFADLSIPLVADGDTQFVVPNGMSGRIYVSTGSKLRFKVVVDGAGNAALQHPAGWVRADPSFGVVHDFVEFTHNDAGMFCNTTAVDMFSVPMAIGLRGSADQTTGRLAAGGRAAVFDAMRAHPVFAPLVVDDADRQGVRVIAPGHGLEAGIFPTTYFDGYIDAVWNQYTSRQLTVDVGTGTRVGTVSGGLLRFDGGVAPFVRPSTRDVLFCDGALAAPNDGVTGPVAAVLGAGFNRSTLLTQPAQPATDPAGFYRDPTTNHYARVLHEHSADGRAYGFAFDDVAGFASYIQDTAPTSATLWLTPF
ncbi:glycoside hydrolase family 64 protein [Frankia sp. Mgl5]|uniref:glycoside hydrolase family 64 protein n=1 Tax=Frankia sp. Mgl5 TaxID=2933793 RepID=UPI00200DD98C|nr:glycoside hydrolase family 64 protein [Frankia sp. Mgl5]